MSHELGSKPKKLFSGVKGYNAFMKKIISVNAYADSKTAQYRLEVINYYRRFGLEATLAEKIQRASAVYERMEILARQVLAL